MTRELCRKARPRAMSTAMLLPLLYQPICRPLSLPRAAMRSPPYCHTYILQTMGDQIEFPKYH